MYEEPPPVRKPPTHRRPQKRIPTSPPDSDASLHQPPRTITPPFTPPVPSNRQEEPVHPEDDHTPRIYTEETVVS